MRKFLIGLCFLGLTSSAFAQDVIYSAKIKKEKVPAEVVSAVDNDFKGYSVVDYSAIPVTLVEDNVVVTADKDFDPSDYDSYEVTLSGKNTTMNAYYNSDGRLVSTYENIKDIALPSVIERAIESKYPKAKVLSDRYVSTNYKMDGKTKVYYHVEIMNNGEKHRLYIDGNGNIIRG